MSNRGIMAGAEVDGTDWLLPAIVQVFGNGTNAVTSAGFAVLPTTTCTASMTNPHPRSRLLVMVSYGAWMGAAAGSDVRACLDVSGSLVAGAGIGGGGPVGWGEVLYAASAGSDQRHAMCTYELPVSGSAATFKTFALRTGAGATTCNYPTIRIVPVRYL